MALGHRGQEKNGRTLSVVLIGSAPRTIDTAVEVGVDCYTLSQ